MSRLPFRLGKPMSSFLVLVFLMVTLGNTGCTRARIRIPLQISSFAVAVAPLSLTLTNFTGGQAIAGGSIQTIDWSATDGVSLGAAPVSLSVSSDGGATWSSLAAGLPGSGAYSWNVPAAVNSATYRIRVTAVDSAGNSAQDSSASNFTIDSTAPTFTSLTVNGASSGGTTANNYVNVSLQTSDNLTPVTHVCFKPSSTAPSLSDSCWVAVNLLGTTPATSITVTNAPFVLGFTPGLCSVYSWVRDQAGNISALTAAGSGTVGTDKATITYSPGSPPTVVNVVGAATATPANPPGQADLTITVGSNVFIQWNISLAPNGLGATPVSVFYTTDDTNYVPVATNLMNGANGCTADAQHTGCYLWSSGAPTNGYFKIRVTITDSQSMTSTSTGPGINTWPPIHFLAGNTDPGTGGSATAAVFLNNTAFSYIPDADSLAVAEDGTVYFRDLSRGILKISPLDGVQRILIPLNPANPSNFGDGGLATAATVKAPYRITLDFSGNLLIWDYDRIRKVDISTGKINTLIGGGSSAADGVAPTAVQISNMGASVSVTYQGVSFFALPNGDIYFTDNPNVTPAAGYRTRVYKASLNQVQSIYFTGTGDRANASQDITQCLHEFPGFTYDPASSTVLSAMSVIKQKASGACAGGVDVPYTNYSVSTWAATPVPSTGTFPPDPFGVSGTGVPPVPHQGHDGNLYVYRTASAGNVAKYNFATNSWTTLIGVGGGSTGTCADGTLATACLNGINSIYVTAQGHIYFVDRGRIRTLDSSNKVVTIMGQGFSFGDGGAPLSARFNVVNSIDMLNSGDVILQDQNELRLRKFSINGTINTIAGTGSNGGAPYSTIAAASTISLQSQSAGQYYDDFKADPVSGDIYMGAGGAFLEKLVAATGKFVTLVGGGGTLYSSADGLAGNAVTFTLNANAFDPRVVGWDGSNVLAMPMSRNVSGQNINPMLKAYNGATGAQTGIAGLNTGAVSGTAYCSGTVAASSCAVPDSQTDFFNTRATYDSFPGTPRWVVMAQGTTKVKAIDIILSGSSNTGNAYDLATLATSAVSFAYRHDAANNIIYYCGTDGLLHKRDNNTTLDTAYPWPVSSMRCAGRTLVYSPGRNSLVFPYTVNGLYGIAEYTAP